MARDGADAALGTAAYGSARVSAQRLTIARAADAELGRAFSVEDLADRVRRKAPGIGLATVYRAVAAMEAAGFVEPLGPRDGAMLYARCRHGGHHHHMLCTGCGAVADVACPVSADVSARPAGFEVTGHRLVLYGTCASCCERAAGGGHDARP
jgi:Fur family transcriptional regulator, ferric uptake regulator